MSGVFELSMVLLACTTPALAIIALVMFLRGRALKQRTELELAAQHGKGEVNDLRHELLALRARVEVLEGIVTDRAYSLREEFSTLDRDPRRA